MGQRPDEVGRRDPLGDDVRDPDTLAGETGLDPATDAFEPDAITPDPALRDEAAAEVDEVETTRVEIERTRAGMSETVDAIQERLSPENLKEQAKDRVKEATVGKAQEAGSGIVGTIKANPLPAALTGIGLGWLLMNARKSSSEQARYRGDRRYAYDYGHPPARDYPPRYEDVGASGTSAGQAAQRARDGVGETATQVQDKAGQLAGQAQEKAGQVASSTQDRVSNLGEQARYQAQRASGGFQRMLQENPLAVGVLGVGVGAAVGLAIPETSKEHEVMGEARDNLVDKAQEKAQDAQQRVQRVAEEAQGAAQQEAENQGLTDQ
jgi:ElaB/YqjD/DUF883 family membrane-anchored ribosome-binding protein